MIVVDTNILLYAINSADPRHAKASEVLESAFRSGDSIGLPWMVLVSFLRLSTSRSVFPSPLTAREAADVVDSWLDQSAVTTLEPGPDHWKVMSRLIAETGRAGDLVNDMHIAALAIERGAELLSADTDFARFRGLRWTNPFAQ